MKYDIAIIGGGIVGVAAAMVLTRRYKCSLVVIEAEDRLAAHQSGHNSGVIHSGLYYRPGSLKADNCVLGRELMYRFCAENEIPHEQCGKVVVATKESEIPVLKELERRGLANGLRGLRVLTPEDIRAYEPHVAGVAGLFVPQTGIVDYVNVTEAFASLAKREGAHILTGLRLIGFRRDSDGLLLETGRGEIACRYGMNCGGLQSDRIARLCGIDPGVQIVPFRGEYYEIIPERRALVNNLIYPVPDPAFPFLGVHFTRMIQGGVEAGPNAVLALKREGYTKWSFSCRDAVETFSYRGFWRLAGRHFREGMGEIHRSLSKKGFVKALQNLIPEIEENDLRSGGAGVRAQALTPEGFLVDDFRVVQADRMIHVLNAPSPAATASISIAETLADMARKQFNLVPKT
ncbi:MAG: L-2-hydroxyglutarate oxidase [Pseudomonadota bacterium]